MQQQVQTANKIFIPVKLKIQPMNHVHVAKATSILSHDMVFQSKMLLYYFSLLNSWRGCHKKSNPGLHRSLSSKCYIAHCSIAFCSKNSDALCTRILVETHSSLIHIANFPMKLIPILFIGCDQPTLVVHQWS